MQFFTFLDSMKETAQEEAVAIALTDYGITATYFKGF